MRYATTAWKGSDALLFTNRLNFPTMESSGVTPTSVITSARVNPSTQSKYCFTNPARLYPLPSLHAWIAFS